jgi:hypothetical protein
VHPHGRVEVTLTIAFHLQKNSSLSKSFKSILRASGSQKLDRESVSIIDEGGHVLPFNHSIVAGWHRVDFDFIHESKNITSNEYIVSLTYTILHGICRTSSGQRRLDIGWAHLWRVPVEKSRYELAFAGTQTDYTSSGVCFGSFDRTGRCGSYSSNSNEKQTAYETEGKPLGAFFTWIEASSRDSVPPCQDDIQSEAGASKSDGESRDHRIEAEAKSKESDSDLALIAMIVIPVSFGLVAGICIFKGRSKIVTIARSVSRSWPAHTRQRDSVKSSDTNTSLPKDDVAKGAHFKGLSLQTDTHQVDLEECALPTLLKSPSSEILKSHRVDFKAEDDLPVKTSQLPSLSKPRPPPLNLEATSVSIERCVQTWSAMADCSQVLQARSSIGGAIFL